MSGTDWCEHIRWEEAHSGEYFWWFNMDDDLLKSYFPDQDCSEKMHVPNSWTCCPICGATRAERHGGELA